MADEDKGPERKYRDGGITVRVQPSSSWPIRMALGRDEHALQPEAAHELLRALSSALAAYAEPVPGHQRVRVAIAVSPDGSWHADGWGVGATGTPSAALLAKRALESMTREGGHVVWLEGDVPLPASRVVRGRVERDADPGSSSSE